jgi:serine/threonine protein kinase
MAEPDNSPENSPADAGSAGPAPENAASSHVIKLAAELFPGVTAGQTDNTPTIISRSPLATIRAEEAFANMLRGKRLAHFELLGSLGIGGMAAVVRARDTQLDRIVALKILPPDMAADPEIVRRFHQEARAAAKLDHENIARVFFCGEDQGLHFIAFELVEGENLKTLLEERGKIPVPEALGYMLQIATGLAHAAARGVVHRDIKPSNIIISSNGRAKLVDMGLARSLDPNTDGGLTQSGVTLGTFDYISPEQALEPRDADVRSDIYSLGCTFYHMLTGHPPVPEGTAAKKLHHHQNIDPLDPRQLNAQIPDDVAALLARMMAKDPRDRYQRPEQLVQHLIVLAQKLGAVNEVTDAVLFVDAPLLGPQRTRPLLIAGLAGLILVVLVVILAPPSGRQIRPLSRNPVNRTGSNQGQLEKVQNAESQAGSEAARDTEGTNSGSKPVSLPYHAKDAKGLAEYLRSTPNAHVYLSQNLKLTRDHPLVFQGQNLTIEPEPGPDQSKAKFAPTLALTYDSQPGGTWTILKILSGSVTIRGVRFELDTLGGNIPMSVIERQGGQLIARSCEFYVNKIDSTQRERVSAISVFGNSPQDEPAVKLHYCYFPGGKDALYLAGSGKVQAFQCAFGTYGNSLFVLDKKTGQDADPRRTLTLSNCSAFVASAAFHIEDGIEFSIHTDNCVFSYPEEDNAGATPGVLFEQWGGSSTGSRYVGSGNCYHNLRAFWAKAPQADTQDLITTLAAFKQRFPYVRDEGSVEPPASPWLATNPLRELSDDKPRIAFELRKDQASLRLARDRQQMIGVQRCAWGELYAQPLPRLADPKRPDAVAQNQQRIVDPNAETRANTYKKLSQAVDEAQPGDVILIRYTGLLREDPVRIKDANANLTIRPHDGYHPILTIGQSPEPDAALVRVHDGKVAFENLEFRLAPDKAGYTAQTVAMIVGDGQCSFSNCLATLEPREGVNLSMVTLNDPSAVMKMMPQPTQQEDPRITITGCFVRGSGQMLSVRVSRPFEFKAEDSLLALNGSMLVMDANPKEPSASRNASITLSHLTTYLTEHLILLRAVKENGAKGLVATQIKSVSDCLFASAGTKALIHLEGIDTPEGQMERYISWSDSQRNAYSNYTQYVEQQPASDAMPQPPLTANAWKDFTRDPDSRFDRVRFSQSPAPDASLSRVPASSFKPTAVPPLQGCGANVERLPKSTDDEGADKADDSLKD